MVPEFFVITVHMNYSHKLICGNLVSVIVLVINIKYITSKIIKVIFLFEINLENLNKEMITMHFFIIIQCKTQIYRTCFPVFLLLFPGLSTSASYVQLWNIFPIWTLQSHCPYELFCVGLTDFLCRESHIQIIIIHIRPIVSPKIALAITVNVIGLIFLCKNT